MYAFVLKMAGIWCTWNRQILKNIRNSVEFSYLLLLIVVHRFKGAVVEIEKKRIKCNL